MYPISFLFVRSEVAYMSMINIHTIMAEEVGVEPTVGFRLLINSQIPATTRVLFNDNGGS